MPEQTVAAATRYSSREPGPADVLARVFNSRRAVLLRAHRRRLPSPQDLEDCLGQAVLELLAAAQQQRLSSVPAHVATALETRFQSRIIDRQRALGGRSAIAHATWHAVPIDDAAWRPAGAPAPVDHVIAREELQRLLGALDKLTDDQRVVIIDQAFGQGSVSEFCQRHRWTPEKARKVSQRGRARLAC